MRLTVGDKIIIKKGMQIRANIPEKFINPDKPFSSNNYFTFITVGNVYDRKKVSKKEVFDEFKKRMDDFFCLTDYEIEKIIDAHPIIFFPEKYYTDYYVGTYTVTGIETTLIGDLIIYARLTSNPSQRISFYLESNTYPTITDIEIVS